MFESKQDVFFEKHTLIYGERKFLKSYGFCIRVFSYYNEGVKYIQFLQGRVKFPIGGKVRERFCAGFGAIPKPTV